MEVCGTLTKDQGGFRKNRSTIDIVTQFTDDIFLGMNNKQTPLATYIDFSKAFHTVNHNILLAKLEMNGIKGKTRDLIRSYLNSRKQRTMTNNKLSDTLAVNCGVPQGSILGPFLFLVYINDMSKLDLECNIKLFADDTVIYTTGKNMRHIMATTLQTDINKLTNWCDLNQIAINCQKTKFMVFGGST